jgi:hypothetical protein
MTRRRGGPTKTEQARRRAELLPIMRELSALGDYAAAKELNRRGVKAMRGGAWKDNQVSRIRRQLHLENEQAVRVARFRKIRSDLIKFFGEPSPPVADLIVRTACWTGYVVDRFNQVHSQRAENLRFNRANPESARAVAALPADVWRQYKRDIALLTVSIELAQIASDAFASAAQKSLLWEILQTGTGIAAEFELAMKPAFGADSDTAGTA